MGPTTPRAVAVGLARCSTDRQEKSIEDQEREIRAWASERQLTLLEVFKDEAVSGSELDRQGVRDLLKLLGAHTEPGVVVLWKRDRLARALDPREAMALEWKILELGWKLEFVHGFSSTGDPMMDALASVMEHIQSGMQLRNVSIDVLRRLVQHVLEGDAPGGKIPYAFAKKITAPDGQSRIVARGEKHRKVPGERATLVAGDPAEIATLRRIFACYVSGTHGLSALAQQLNSEEVPAVEGREWTAGTLRELLLNEGYTGTLVWNKETTAKVYRLAGGKPVPRERARKSRKPGFESKSTTWAANDPKDWIRIPNHHEALIDRELFEQAGALMRGRGGQRNKGRSDTQLFPLTGVAYCEACGSSMNGRTQQAKGHEYPKYFCAAHSRNRSCKPNAVAADKLERALLRKMKETFVPQLPRTDLRERVIEILKQRFLNGEQPAGIDPAALRHERATLERKIDRAIANLGEVGPAAARELGKRVEEWSARVGTIDALFAQAERDKLTMGRRREDIEKAADEILGLVDRLDTIAMDAPALERRQLFQKSIQRMELRFRTEPAGEGRKRERHVFEQAAVKATGLLDVVQQAGCTRDWLLG